MVPDRLSRVRAASSSTPPAVRVREPNPLVETASAAILGESAAIVALRRSLSRVAQSSASSVLIVGETGTGKELIAHALHGGSARSARRFVAVNCSALPATLLEEEFFGHEAGAFTDARTRKAGLLEAADGGTLFLDEISELALPLQAKFLRFLEEHDFRRVGGTTDVSVDVRFVAATNVDPEQLVREGRFRADLYYRLAVVTLRVPPLRERLEDVPLLAMHFLRLYAQRFHKSFEGFEPSALEALQQHTWPGNVRELRNAIERVLLLEDGPLVTAAALGLAQRRGAAARESEPDALATSGELDLERLELRALATALERTHGNLTRAARLLGISRDTVRYRMEKHGARVETRVSWDHPEPTH